VTRPLPLFSLDQAEEALAELVGEGESFWSEVVSRDNLGSVKQAAGQYLDTTVVPAPRASDVIPPPLGHSARSTRYAFGSIESAEDPEAAAVGLGCLADLLHFKRYVRPLLNRPSEDREACVFTVSVGLTEYLFTIVNKSQRSLESLVVLVA